MKWAVPSPPITGPSIPAGEAFCPELVCLLFEVDVCCAEQMEMNSRVDRAKAMLVLMWRIGRSFRAMGTCEPVALGPIALHCDSAGKWCQGKVLIRASRLSRLSTFTAVA